MKQITKLVILSIALSLTTACASTAKKFDAEVQNTDAANVYPTIAAAIESLPVETVVADKPISVEFTKADKLVMIMGRKAPVKRLTIQVGDLPFLRVSSVHIQNVLDGKTIGVHPRFKILKGTQEMRVTKKKARWRSICGLNACNDQYFEMTSIPKGTYDLIIAAYVGDPEKSDGELKDSLGRSAPLYPAYYGEVRFEFLSSAD